MVLKTDSYVGGFRPSFYIFNRVLRRSLNGKPSWNIPFISHRSHKCSVCSSADISSPSSFSLATIMFLVAKRWSWSSPRAYSLNLVVLDSLKSVDSSDSSSIFKSSSPLSQKLAFSSLFVGLADMTCSRLKVADWQLNNDYTDSYRDIGRLICIFKRLSLSSRWLCLS